VCYDTDADTVLLSCGHGGLCVECAARLWRSDRRCPLCRRDVHGVLVFRTHEATRFPSLLGPIP
jgi:hypothetical protein